MIIELYYIIWRNMMSKRRSGKRSGEDIYDSAEGLKYSDFDFDDDYYADDFDGEKSSKWRRRPPRRSRHQSDFSKFGDDY